MKEKVNRVYDVQIVDKVLWLHLYQAYLVNENDLGKRTSYYTFENIGDYIPENIEEEITNLRKKGYNSSVDYGSNMPLVSLNPLINLKNKNCKLLERAYDEVMIEGILYLVPYLIYMDMKTGKVFFKRESKPLSGAYLENLESLGYIPLGNSILAELPELNAKTGKVRELKKCL